MTWTATFGTRQCKVCSADFTARQHNAKYCSMDCYNKRKQFQPKQALLTSVDERIIEAYRRGYIDGGIGVMNGELPHKRRIVSKEELAKELGE